MTTLNPRTIMAAIADPEEGRQLVLERAAQLAAAFKSDLVLFHAAFESTLSGRPFFDTKRLARSRRWRLDEVVQALEGHARTLRGRGLTVRTLAVWEEPAHESIVRAAIREDAGLVVAGPHIRGRANAPFPLRRTDWELLRLCPRPLLLVRSPARRTGPVIAALDPFHADDKPATLDRALAAAAAKVANALNVPWLAAHSVSPALYALGASDAERARQRERAAGALRRLLERAHVEPLRTYVLDGRPEDALPALAAKQRAQLLVMGAISRRGLQRFAVGDTAERVIHASPCDLLILKPRGFKPRLGRVRREPLLPQPTARG